MHKFIPFEEFKQQLETARHKESQEQAVTPPAEPQAGGQPEVTPENLREMSDYLAAQHRKMQVVHSFLGDDGQYIDCVKADTQPGLQPGQHVATPPAFITNSGFRSTLGSWGRFPKNFTEGRSVWQCDGMPCRVYPRATCHTRRNRSGGQYGELLSEGPGGGTLPPSPRNRLTEPAAAIIPSHILAAGTRGNPNRRNQGN